MIARPTLVIFGAGASMPFRFPSGRQPLFEITSGILQPRKLLGRLRKCGFNPEDCAAFANSLNLSQQPSVDAFLESRPEYTDLGKAAIAATLIPYENDALLARAPRSSNWFEYLFNILRVPTSPEFSENRLSVMTFNYDRSFERLMYLALQHSYALDDGATRKLMSHIPILRPHGALGEFDPDFGNYRPYDSLVSPDTIRIAAASIKVIHDDIDSTPSLDLCRAAITDDEVICFVGFGFNPKTLARLALDRLSSRQSVFASAFDVTESEREKIKWYFPKGIAFGGVDHDALRFLRESRALVLARMAS